MKFKTKPFKHQKKVFNLSKDATGYALFMEQGTGKSKVILDNTVYLYSKGGIELLIIIAKNGVHHNWIINEIPTHLALPNNLYRACSWGLSMNKREKYLFKLVTQPNYNGLRIITVNIEAFSYKKTYDIFSGLLNMFDTFLTVDESTGIKNPKALRTKNIVKLGKYGTYKRILTGTPVTKGPLDLYAPFRFLGLPIGGITSYISYKNTFADWEKKINRKTKRQYEELVRYKNISYLKKEIGPHSFRVTKDECLDLPAKIYEKRYIELTKEQEKVYSDICEELKTEIGDHEVTTNIVLVKMLRLQQIIGGFIGTDEKKVIPIPGKNNRLETLLETINETQGKIIIWSRFVAEIEIIGKELKRVFGNSSTVSYYGAVKKENRKENIKRFQEDDTCRFFIGQQHSAGYGLTLTAASTVIYYSNDFSLEARLQSEDRAHRIGLKHNVTYIDFETIGTIDEYIITSLRSKKNIADNITGDRLIQWL